MYIFVFWIDLHHNTAKCTPWYGECPALRPPCPGISEHHHYKPLLVSRAAQSGFSVDVAITVHALQQFTVGEILSLCWHCVGTSVIDVYMADA